MSSSQLATALVAPFEQLRMSDVEVVGGKNASLGEMISQLAASGVRVPGGFATTAHAFREFLQHRGLAARISDRLATIIEDLHGHAERDAPCGRRRSPEIGRCGDRRHRHLGRPVQVVEHRAEPVERVGRQLAPEC